MGRKKKHGRKVWLGIAVASGLLLAGGLVFWLTLPPVSRLKKENPRETVMMRLHNEQARQKGWRTQRLQQFVPLSRISPFLVQAVLIAEDDKFFAHEGFDWESMRKALEANLSKKRILRGGSTITQQLAKNLFLGSEQTVWRKLREAAIAFKLEHALSKKRILELYLNLADWGRGAYGARAAAQRYFQVPAADLGLAQAIRLASVLPNPHRFPVLGAGNQRMNRKRRLIARRMLQRRWISPEAHAQALQEMGIPN